jgi:hypothetical protein
MGTRIDDVRFARHNSKKMGALYLLNRHSIPSIGLLQLDTEGFDFEIIKMVDFCKQKPILSNFEDGFSDRSERRDCL